MNDIKELKIDMLRYIKEIWCTEFKKANIAIPDLKLELNKGVKDFAIKILLNCYLPSSLISEETNTETMDYFYFPINLYNHLKLSIKNKLPQYINKYINVKNKEIPIMKRTIIRKVGVHPSYFDVKNPLSKIHYIR